MPNMNNEVILVVVTVVFVAAFGLLLFPTGGDFLSIQDKSLPSSLDNTADASKNLKIDSTVVGFLNSQNKTDYAIRHGLEIRNETIQIYLVLNESNSTQLLPNTIQIERTEGNIVQTRITADQIKELSKLDFVNQIQLPKYALPVANELNTESAKNQTFDKYYLLLVIPIAIMGIGVWQVFRKRYKNVKGDHNEQK